MDDRKTVGGLVDSLRVERLSRQIEVRKGDRSLIWYCLEWLMKIYFAYRGLVG